MKKIIYNILHPIKWYNEKKEFKKRMKILRERDPFIYK